MKELLIRLKACSEAREWAGDKSIEQIVAQCHRGDWLLWLAANLEIGIQPLILAKGHCVNTIRHIMKDDRSIKAIDVAISFGEGKATKTELDAAYGAADAAYADAAGAAAAYAAGAAAAAYAAADSAYAAAADSAYAAAAYGADYAAAKKANQKQTADICRKYIGQLIVDKVNETFKTTSSNPTGWSETFKTTQP